jgi:hypothetical protein
MHAIHAAALLLLGGELGLRNPNSPTSSSNAAAWIACA